MRVHEPTGPSEGYLQLEELVKQVVSPFLGISGDRSCAGPTYSLVSAVVSVPCTQSCSKAADVAVSKWNLFLLTVRPVLAEWMQQRLICMWMLCGEALGPSGQDTGEGSLEERTMQYQVRRATVKLREQQQNHSAGLT
ncbi:hypothetical protein U0070_024320 [Myodes glareolus]|uniref:Uncharacterized protein n=1 Tax=Myodes glareolus TaxID=447135 RepID=A0AAW0IKM2_MYOGA